MNLSPLRIVKATEVLLPSTAITATGATLPVSGYGGADSLVFELDVTAVSGTNPTLDVVIQDTMDGTNYFTIATFTQATAATHAVQRVNMTTTRPMDSIRASYTIGGTATPTFTFSITAYAEAKISSDRQP